MTDKPAPPGMADPERLALHAQVNSLRTALSALFIASSPDVQQRTLHVLAQLSALQQQSDAARHPDTACFIKAETAALDALHRQLVQGAQLWRDPAGWAGRRSTPSSG